VETTIDTRVRRASHLQRDYRSVLDAAKVAIVGVLDRDDTLLAIGRMDSIVFHLRVVEALEEVGQFEAAYARHADEPASEWAEMTPFPWLASLEPDEVREFRADLLPHLLLAVHEGDLEPYVGNLRAWESTAETVNDVEMMAQMLAPIDSDRLAELYPPEPDGDQEADEDVSTTA
jgi:hypothetical protein